MKNSACIVRKLWTTGLVCGSDWKTREKPSLYLKMVRSEAACNPIQSDQLSTEWQKEPGGSTYMTPRIFEVRIQFVLYRTQDMFLHLRR